MTSPRIIVIAPDSFKGSLTSIEAAQAVAQGVQRVWPDAAGQIAFLIGRTI